MCRHLYALYLHFVDMHRIVFSLCSDCLNYIHNIHISCIDHNIYMCVSHCFPQGQGLGCGAVLTPRLASLLADALDIPTAQLRILPVSDDITSRLRDWASVSVCRWPSHCRSISNYVAVALTDETA